MTVGDVDAESAPVAPFEYIHPCPNVFAPVPPLATGSAVVSESDPSDAVCAKRFVVVAILNHPVPETESKVEDAFTSEVFVPATVKLPRTVEEALEINPLAMVPKPERLKVLAESAPKFALVEKRFVDDAVVEKKLVEVAFVTTKLSNNVEDAFSVGTVNVPESVPPESER